MQPRSENMYQSSYMYTLYQLSENASYCRFGYEYERFVKKTDDEHIGLIVVKMKCYDSWLRLPGLSSQANLDYPQKYRLFSQYVRTLV